ncbi:MAG: EAL domain-containing protein [Lachnospiraceae bacterium]|nr:EAL domain-containing protein [Lachnospiraceae bacterium]
MFEITESAYADNADTLVRVVDNLRNHGFKIEMDDFGSGYSSLNMLTTITIDVIKIDMKFIRNMLKDEKSLRMVKLIDHILFGGIVMLTVDALKNYGADTATGLMRCMGNEALYLRLAGSMITEQGSTGFRPHMKRETVRQPMPRSMRLRVCWEICP